MDLNFSLLGTRGFLCFAQENGLDQGNHQLLQNGHPVNENVFPSSPIIELCLCVWCQAAEPHFAV